MAGGAEVAANLAAAQDTAYYTSEASAAGARHFLARDQPAQAGLAMLARGFSRRAGSRGRKRLGYRYQGRLCGLKSKILMDTSWFHWNS